MSKFLQFIACLFVLAFALPANAQEGKSPHITAKLTADVEEIGTGRTLLKLDYTAAPGWHTYFINPGDTGLAPQFTWNLPDDVSVGTPKWPVPETLPSFGLISYGYTGRTILPIPLYNFSKLTPGNILPIKAHIDFLVCADVCVPESLDVSLNLKVAEPPALKPEQIPMVAPPADDVKAAPPEHVEWRGTFSVMNGVAELGFKAVNGATLDKLSRAQGAYFYPLRGGLLVPSSPQVVDMGPSGFTIRTQAKNLISRDGKKCTPVVIIERPLPYPQDGGLNDGCDNTLYGYLKLSDGSTYPVGLYDEPLPADVHGLGAIPATKGVTSLSGILIAIAGAFIGGLILNLMPCVFPVLSMKLLSLARSGHDKGLAQQESLFYGAGTILTFVVLALILTAAQTFGQSIGWGFQLQSPYVTAGLSLIMLLVALNMSGVFEIGTSLQAVGGLQVSAKRPRLGALLTGILAVVVAAPCTAPFMATAIGVALAQGGPVLFAIFVSLGIGFALPFVVLTYLITLVPAVAKALPRPGKWMDILKHALSLLMYAACLWLIWVFAQQVETYGLILLVFALVLVIMAVLKNPLPKFIKPAVLVGGLVLCGLAASLPRTEKVPSVPTGLMAHQDFSVESLAALRAQGKPVFVDLTAAWCVTCKVNERLVLTTKDFEAAVADTGTVYMVGDWTNQDAAIARYLTLFGRSGVPLYVYYGPNNAEPVVLPQLLKTADVVKTIRGR